MDLGHVFFVHRNSAGVTTRKMQVEVTEENNTVCDRRFSTGSTGLQVFAKALGNVEGLYDNWLDIKWSPVAIQAAIPDAERLSLKPMPFLHTDASGVRVAGIIDRLLAAEAQGGSDIRA